MKKLAAFLSLTAALFFLSHAANAQLKFGYISTQELITSLPEFKKADTAMQEYQQALNQQYLDMVADFNQQDSVLKITPSKFTVAQRSVKEQALQELYRRIQGWQQQAQDLSQRKQQELLAPVYDKVKKAIADVAKENGFTFIFNKEQLLVSPPGDDILPLVKKKLNIK